MGDAEDSEGYFEGKAQPYLSSPAAANLTQDKYGNKLLLVIADYPHNVDRLFHVRQVSLVRGERVG